MPRISYKTPRAPVDDSEAALPTKCPAFMSDSEQHREGRYPDISRAGDGSYRGLRCGVQLHSNSPHLIQRDLIRPPAVDLGRPRAGVIGREAAFLSVLPFLR
jgi:hypothetical protein